MITELSWIQTSNSIYRKCCIKTHKYFILTIKENCQTDSHGKFGIIEFIELWSYFIAFQLGKLCPGVGILFRFLRPGGRSFALKSCPQGGDFDGKN